MNALIFLAVFFVALTIACMVADGFHKIQQARSVTRYSPRSRDTGTDAENVSGASRADTAPRPSPLSRSSAGASSLPGGSGTPEVHELEHAERDHKHPVRPWRATCTCGCKSQPLPSEAACRRWVLTHGAIQEALVAKAEEYANGEAL